MILSTHIVPDIESIATRIAMMRRGRVIRDAAPEALLAQTEGHVWEAVVSSQAFEEARVRLRISSAVRKPDGVHVRVVQATPPFPGAQPVEPGLEDAFIHAMNDEASLPE